MRWMKPLTCSCFRKQSSITWSRRPFYRLRTWTPSITTKGGLNWASCWKRNSRTEHGGQPKGAHIQGGIDIDIQSGYARAKVNRQRGRCDASVALPRTDQDAAELQIEFQQHHHSCHKLETEQGGYNQNDSRQQTHW